MNDGRKFRWGLRGVIMEKIKDSDLKRWDMHLYLAREIAWCADYLSKHDHGYPSPYVFPGITYKKWTEILKTIAHEYRGYFERDGDYYVYTKGKKHVRLDKRAYAKFKHAQELFTKYYEQFWD